MANGYMLQAVRNTDEVFGDGYAKDHPELVGAYMQTIAIEEQSRTHRAARGFDARSYGLTVDNDEATASEAALRQALDNSVSSGSS